MQNVKEILHILIELQGVDSKLQEYTEEKNKSELEIKNIENTITAIQTHAEMAKKEVTQYKIKLKNLENDLANIEEQIKKHQKELSLVKTNEAYKVLMDKINKTKQDKIKIEDGMLSLMEKIDNLEKEYKNEIKKINDEEKMYMEKIDVIKRSIKEKEEVITKTTDLRNKIFDKLKEKDEDIGSLYEDIHRTRNGLAVVEVIEDRYCNGCNISLPVEFIEQLRKNDKIYTCDNCSRILYIPSSLATDADTNTGKDVKSDTMSEEKEKEEIRE